MSKNTWLGTNVAGDSQVCNFMTENNIAVSYTHLDVYKRQI